MSECSPANLYPYPEKVEWLDGYAIFKENAILTLCGNLSDETVRFFSESWASFTRNQVELSITKATEVLEYAFILTDGDSSPDLFVLEDGFRSCLEVEEAGAQGLGVSEIDLKHAWISMLQLLVCGRNANAGSWLMHKVLIQDKPRLKFRGLHLCVFPETSLEFVDKMITLAAFQKYSHVVLEFWGMLNFDCLKELSWPNGYSKEEVKPLLAKARRMGLEPIPMFNHWGHAAGCRCCNGKHVLLDQNPDLEALFEPDGWTWCLTNPDTLKLLGEIRSELRELFGSTEYFHLGCDESYSHGSCPECSKHDSPKLLADFLNSVNDDLKKYGARPIIWGDALLEHGKWDGFAANSKPYQRTHEALDLLSKDFIINDWHYHVMNRSQNGTIKHFMERDFDVLTAPWSNNIGPMADIAIDENAMGMILTTWHTLPAKVSTICVGSEFMWNGTDRHTPPRRSGYGRTAMATYLRKLRGTPTKYLDAGWREEDTNEHALQ